jgi:diguanylate cyclase (GGDEF)-like protein/PAS domain S-box-containing protein
MNSDWASALLTEADLFTDTPVRSVGQLVSGHLLSCPPDTTVSEAACLMRASHCSSIVIVEDGLPVGIWTERDALTIDLARPRVFDQPISAVMTQPVQVIDGNASVSAAGGRLGRENIRHLLVVNGDGTPIGMLSQTDVVRNHGAEHYLTFRDVRSVMSSRLPTLPADMPLAEAAHVIYESGGEAAAVIASDWADIGIVTERDIVRMIAERRAGTVGEAASRPAITVHPDATLLVARNLFIQHGFRHLIVRDDGGALIGLLSFSDILNVLQYEFVEQINAALIRSHKDFHLARQVIEAALDAVMIVDAQVRIEYVNPAFTRLTGYAAAEAIGQTPNLLKSGRHEAKFYEKMWAELTEAGHWQGEIWNRRKNGEIFAEWLTVTSLRGDDGHITKYAAIFNDITEKKKTEEFIWYQANYDALTGLPNRRLFHDRLEQDLKKAHRAGLSVALLFIDLDRFKEVNDTRGHHVGDQLLKEAAQRISLCVRESDTVARLGGDEFVAILTGVTDPTRTEQVAEQIIRSLEKPFQLGREKAYLSASVGITLYPGDALDVHTMLKNADQALYVAKNQGRNRFSYFTASMQAAAQERLKLTNDLHDAVATGQLEVYFQPIVDLATNRTVKAEALLRWHHPERGTVSPDQFIPIAEETGLINEIDDAVFREAARMAKRWNSIRECRREVDSTCQTDAHPCQISVNKSPRQFSFGNRHKSWIAFLEEIGLSGQCISIEITEGLLLDDSPDVARQLKELRDAGFEISLDDFGTGYSALSYVIKFNIDYLKIDQSFVRDLASNPRAKAIVEAIIVMAHKLGITVVAEGVETEEQRDFLVAAGCDLGQGYLFTAPLPAADFLRHVALPGRIMAS